MSQYRSGSVHLNSFSPIDKCDGVVSERHRITHAGNSGRADDFILGSLFKCWHAGQPNLLGRLALKA
jgi:hypothetical protein